MPIFMVLLFLGNAMMPLENPPAFISAIMPFAPSYYMTEALRAVMMHGKGLGSTASRALRAFPLRRRLVLDRPLADATAVCRALLIISPCICE